jgi:hypothetical protein
LIDGSDGREEIILNDEDRNASDRANDERTLETVI